ncbi:unnamed protein product [Heligmosomoides polygyrus]|uniref:2'-5' RNA ligase n=1 Tax=Heligmosomoides polygyrus TaxID=6339 RepID=A0A183FZD2_HELPZ|nr:unnamed protein product [Heligmosomoides polygyrus]
MVRIALTLPRSMALKEFSTFSLSSNVPIMGTLIDVESFAACDTDNELRNADNYETFWIWRKSLLSDYKKPFSAHISLDYSTRRKT